MSALKSRFFQIFAAGWRRRYMVVMPILIMPLIAMVIGSMTPDIYRSHTSLLIQETAKMNPFLEDIAVSTQIKERINGLRTLLKSRHVLRTVAEEQGLITDQTSNTVADRVIRRLSASLSVSQIGKDYVQISLSASQPQGMEPLLESVSHHFIEQLLAPERSSIQDSSQFLAMHIDKRLNELKQAEQALAEFQNQNPTTTPEFLNENLSRLARLKQTLAEKEALLAGVDKGLGSLDQQLSRTNPVLGKIEEKIIEIRSELTLLTAKYTDNHSAVIANKRELERLEKEREKIMKNRQENLTSEVLWDIASTSTTTDLQSIKPLLVTQLENLQIARSQYESLKEETKAIRTMITHLETQNSRFGDVSKTLVNLKRQVDFKRRLYDELVERYEMAKLTGSLGAFEHNKRVKIIDLPFTPTGKANLPLPVYIIIGLIAGIAIGVGLAIIFELLDTRIYRTETLETLCSAPVLTVIPYIKHHP
jgi:polysaccharide chain length determinant protein (PEP-CTERM system associated)